MKINLAGIVRLLHFQFDSKDIEASRERIRLYLQEFNVNVDVEATKIAEGLRRGEVVLAVTDEGMHFNYFQKHWLCGDANEGWYIFYFDNNRQMYSVGTDGIRKEIEAEPVLVE